MLAFAASLTTSFSVPTSLPTTLPPLRPRVPPVPHRLARRPVRRHGPTALALPPANASQMKQRTIVTLRGLSDLSGLVLLHELSQRIVNPSTSSAILADAQLLFGGLLGVWMAALFAERLRRRHEALRAEAHIVPTPSAPVSRDDPHLHYDELPAAVAWLYALDELDGPAASDMLLPIAHSEDPLLRSQLAGALGTFPIRSNLCLSILIDLLNDKYRLVRHAAQESLTAYEHASIVSRTQTPVVSPPPSRTLALPRSLSTGDDLAVKIGLERLLQYPRPVVVPSAPSAFGDRETFWFQSVVRRQVGTMLDAALSQPNFGSWKRSISNGLHHTRSPSAPDSSTEPPARLHDGEYRRPVEVDFSSRVYPDIALADDMDINVAEMRSAQPLVDSLRWSEIHGISALALVPVLYELCAVVFGESLPLRFVGIGWISALGGLIAYPQSASLWEALRKCFDNLPYKESARE